MSWSLYVPIKAEAPQLVQHVAEWAQMIEMPTHKQSKILTLVSSGGSLQAARSAARDYELRDVVIWAWLLPEFLAQQAEAAFPVVYALPTETQVEQSLSNGQYLRPETQVLHQCEIAFDLGIGWNEENVEVVA